MAQCCGNLEGLQQPSRIRASISAGLRDNITYVLADENGYYIYQKYATEVLFLAVKNVTQYLCIERDICSESQAR